MFKVKRRCNVLAYLAILSVLFLIYLSVIALYETIKESGSDYGRIGNFFILNLAEIFQFPSRLFLTSEDNFYFLGVLIDLCVYSVIIYFMIKSIFRIVKKKYL